MIDKKTLSIADEIVGAINQTDVWTELQREDPGIKDAEDRYDKALEAAQLPREVCIALSDACGVVIAAYSTAAILYGMRVAAALQAVVSDPAELSRYWLAGKEVGE